MTKLRPRETGIVSCMSDGAESLVERAVRYFRVEGLSAGAASFPVVSSLKLCEDAQLALERHLNMGL